MNEYPVYPDSAVTAKSGVNYARTLFESKGCLFQKIDHENDLGIDATIELLQKGTHLKKHLALQIKSGASYFDEAKRECSIPIKMHAQYWREYPLPVIGIVFVPKLDSAYWVDIGTYLRENKCNNNETIKFRASYLNELSADGYEDVFMAWVQSRPLKLSREKTWELFNSADPVEHYSGLEGIFNWYSDTPEVWDMFFSYFKSHDAGEELAQIIRFLDEGAKFSGHDTAEMTSLNESINTRIRDFGAAEVRKLLVCLDEDISSNGSFNSSVVSIISMIPKSAETLTRIIIDAVEDPSLKFNAAIVLAVNEGEDALPALRLMRGNSFIFELIEYIEENGEYSPFV